MKKYQIAESLRHLSFNTIKAKVINPLGFFLLLFAFSNPLFAQSYGTGSGFFITADGYFITNQHVVESSKSIVIRTVDGKRYPAEIVRIDAANDIALLKANGRFNAIPIDRSTNVRRGDRVFTIGFPNIDVQGTEPKYTEGVVSSLTGLDDAPNYFQITAALQPGNSGGPLVSATGNVVGITSGKLSAAAMIKRGGSLPENVNYAVKANYLLELISTLPTVKENLLSVKTNSFKSMSDVADQVTSVVGLVFVEMATDRKSGTLQPSPAPSAPRPPIARLTIGRDYMLVNPSQPTDSGNKIEVIEFFWYGAIHAKHLDLPMQAWLRNKPNDVEFRYVPAIYDPASWGPMAKTFYALDALGLSNKYHSDIFAAIHQDGQKTIVTDPLAMANWLSGRGVNRQRFMETYNSIEIGRKVNLAAEMTRNYKVPGVPALVVNGKYLTGPSMTTTANGNVSYELFFKVLDQLIEQARTER